ncbi:MAG: hypothetical protein KC427_00255 [Sulfurovum sp.]|uniref:hypothetical protein n=1 Tax=Sulfurovum sp. TaxID=1969726 RepID=UPI0028682F68|nr:hypothetical protein [Sulfurovum sp.]MCO4844429.1 hypothetical protein [Sulfurovum sp.]
MGHAENKFEEKYIPRIMSIEAQLESYEENGTLNEQRKVLQKMLVEIENMQNEYLKGMDETFLDKIKHFFGVTIKVPENELEPVIEELMSRVLEENRKVGNFHR